MTTPVKLDQEMKEKLRSLLMDEILRSGTDTNEMSNAGRLSSKNVIQQRIIRLRQEADELSALLEFLPDDLSKEADQALWRLVINR